VSADRVSSSHRQLVADAFAAFCVRDFLPQSVLKTGNQADSGAPVSTYQRADGLVLSAISDRSFLAEIIARIMPLRGKQILEIGSGTGYLAAVLGNLCSPDGQVIGCEIIRELFELSVANIRRAAMSNVTLLGGDFLDALEPKRMFDVVMATSSMSMVHEAILTACCPTGGQLLLPVEIPGGGDCFTIFNRHCDRLEVVYSRLSVSVPTTGRYSKKPIWAAPVDQVLRCWETSHKIIIETNRRYKHFVNDTLAFRSFLLFNEPLFQAVNLGSGHLADVANMAFGLISDKTSSCCLETAKTLILSGSEGLSLAARLTKLQRMWEERPQFSLENYQYEIEIRSYQGFAFDPGFRSKVNILCEP
jgi:protein-L-isoaspartate O-methyltransferase